MFTEGNVLEIQGLTEKGRHACCHWETGDRFTVGKHQLLTPHRDISGATPVKSNYLFTVVQEGITERSNMNKTIAKLFDKTADAVIVSEELGTNIPDNTVEYVRLNGKQKELLALAHEQRNLREKK